MVTSSSSSSNTTILPLLLCYVVLLLVATVTGVVESFALLSSSSNNNIPSRQTFGTRSRISRSSKIYPTKSLYASDREEDLELTRKIILNFLNNGNDVVDEENNNNNNDAPASSSSVSSSTDNSLDRNGSVVVNEQQESTPVQTSSSSTSTSSLAGYLERPKNDNMIRVALGERTVQTPVWLFRQAGRHLPEYHTYKGSKSFLDLLNNPIDVAEVTMQPIRRYKLDAAILFSDILVIIEALGIPITMPGGVGIQVPYPLQHPNDISERLYASEMTSQQASEFVQTKLAHVLESVKLIRQQMLIENISIPLIGFSAAPWTLLYYMVGGTSKKDYAMGMKWLLEYPKDSTKLLKLLSTIVTEYLALQIENGAHIIQIFEAMGMMISDELFEQFAIPCLQQIGTELQNRYKDKDIPIMIFTRGACSNDNLQKIVELNCFNVITIDGSIDRSTIRSIIGPTVPIQGNYDPSELISSNGTTNKTIESVQESTRQYLSTIGPQHLIANLGEGLGGKEDPVLVDAFINAIHDISTEIIATTISPKSTTPTTTTTTV